LVDFLLQGDRIFSPLQTTGMNPRRNDPCPCGSGKKFKHCHGDAALVEAWDEVHLSEEDVPEFDPNSPHLQVGSLTQQELKDVRPVALEGC
jgi:hypothetical protein